MNYKKMLSRVKHLGFDREMSVCEEDGVELFVLRPSKLSKRFKTYDIKKNFQIWLREGSRVFRPNHLRVIIDLHLRVRSRPDLKPRVAQVFDNIFYGKDPDKEIKTVAKEKFDHFLNPLRIVANLSQLFLIEQDYAYHKESKFDPSTLFFQGWLRQAIDDTREIDNVVMSIANRQPPPVRYTHAEDKKHKDFSKNLKPLWWLEG